jgi:hypothetical protein
MSVEHYSDDYGVLKLSDLVTLLQNNRAAEFQQTKEMLLNLTNNLNEHSLTIENLFTKLGLCFEYLSFMAVYDPRNIDYADEKEKAKEELMTSVTARYMLDKVFRDSGVPDPEWEEGRRTFYGNDRQIMFEFEESDYQYCDTSIDFELGVPYLRFQASYLYDMVRKNGETIETPSEIYTKLCDALGLEKIPMATFNGVC